MERYIIPFDHQGKSYYVFIDKDAARQVYLVGKILPFTIETYQREISFHSIATLEESGALPDSLETAILHTLYKFLEARGWLAFAN